nr:urease accessory protein UreD-like [Pocillopora verrucosa]
MGKETSLQPVISQSHVSVPGYGCAEFRCIPQKVSSADESHPIKLKTMNSRLYFTHPLKLLVTRQFSPHCLAQSDCQWIYKVQSGGSHTSLNIDVGENCKVVFTTQEYPKILASDDDSIGEQHLKVHVADGAILAVLPDPIICCKNAKFQQEQVKSRGVAKWSPASAFVNDAAYQLT